MPEDLDQIATPPAKRENITGVRIALERLLDLKGEAVHATPHIGSAGGDEDANA